MDGDSKFSYESTQLGGGKGDSGCLTLFVVLLLAGAIIAALAIYNYYRYDPASREPNRNHIEGK